MPVPIVGRFWAELLPLGQSRAIPGEPQQRHACRCLLRPRASHFKPKRKDQKENYRTPTLAIPQSRRL